MELKNSRGWLLRIYEREEDSVVTFFLDDGRVVNLRALGISSNTSKNRQSLQQYSLVDIEYFQSTNPNTGKLKKAVIYSQIIYENENQKNILDLLKNLVLSFQKLNHLVYDTLIFILENIKFSISKISLIFYFITLIIKEEGIIIDVTKCSICGTRKDISSFSLIEGGLLCKKCITNHDKPLFSSFLEKIIKLFSSFSIIEISSLNFDLEEEKMLKSILMEYLNNNLGLFADLLTTI